MSDKMTDGVEDTCKATQVQGNRLDPLKKTEEVVRELLSRLAKTANGFSQQVVVMAAMNLIINAVRQTCRTRKEAESNFDEIMRNTKGKLLDEHYFPNGLRRNVFPYHQIIFPGVMDARPPERRTED